MKKYLNNQIEKIIVQIEENENRKAITELVKLRYFLQDAEDRYFKAIKLFRTEVTCTCDLRDYDAPLCTRCEADRFID